MSGKKHSQRTDRVSAQPCPSDFLIKGLSLYFVAAITGRRSSTHSFTRRPLTDRRHNSFQSHLGKPGGFFDAGEIHCMNGPLGTKVPANEEAACSFSLSAFSKSPIPKRNKGHPHG
jgi:hypothetical protein